MTFFTFNARSQLLYPYICWPNHDRSTKSDSWFLHLLISFVTIKSYTAKQISVFPHHPSLKKSILVQPKSQQGSYTQEHHIFPMEPAS